MKKILSCISLVSAFVFSLSSSLFVTACSNNLPFIGPLNHPFSQIYVLGDSLSDSGSLMGAATQFLERNPEIAAKKLEFSPVNNKSVYYHNKQFCTGEVAVQHLAHDLGLEINPGWNYTVLQPGGGVYNHYGNDYAVGGSQAYKGTGGTSVVENFFTLQNQCLALLSQHAVNNKLSPNDLFVVESGNNDLFNALGLPNTGDSPTAAQKQIAYNAVWKGEKTVINTLIAHGAKHILVTNVADLAKTPSYQKIEHEVTIGLTSYYNNQWSEMINEEISNNKKGIIKPFDLFSFFDEEINVAKNLGMDIVHNTVVSDISAAGIEKAVFENNGDIAVNFVNNKTRKDLTKDFFLDDVHPTEWMQNQVGQALYKVVIQKW